MCAISGWYFGFQKDFDPNIYQKLNTRPQYIYQKLKTRSQYISEIEDKVVKNFKTNDYLKNWILFRHHDKFGNSRLLNTDLFNKALCAEKASIVGNEEAQKFLLEFNCPLSLATNFCLVNSKFYFKLWVLFQSHRY